MCSGLTGWGRLLLRASPLLAAGEGPVLALGEPGTEPEGGTSGAPDPSGDEDEEQPDQPLLHQRLGPVVGPVVGGIVAQSGVMDDLEAVGADPSGDEDEEQPDLQPIPGGEGIVEMTGQGKQGSHYLPPASQPLPCAGELSQLRGHQGCGQGGILPQGGQTAAHAGEVGGQAGVP